MRISNSASSLLWYIHISTQDFFLPQSLLCTLAPIRTHNSCIIMLSCVEFDKDSNSVRPTYKVSH